MLRNIKEDEYIKDAIEDYEEDEELEVNHKNKDINKFMPIIFQSNDIILPMQNKRLKRANMKANLYWR